LLTGPVLMLNLALNNIFCLHASAFILNEKIFVLMGDSGTGKSTIARYIQENNLGMRVADDILPMKITDDKLEILPNFPQLKLSCKQQYQGEKIYKDVVFLFAQKSERATSLKKTDVFSSLKKIIRHSVATKLFTEKELQNHLIFCHQASHIAQAYMLNYQHHKDALPFLLRLLHGIC